MNNIIVEKSNHVAGVLFQRLLGRNLTPIEVRRLIRDVQIIIFNDGSIGAEAVNTKLTRLGWRDRVLDSFCFELILYLYENREGSDSKVFH